jgi:hypothetical protein
VFSSAAKEHALISFLLKQGDHKEISMSGSILATEIHFFL